MDKTFELISTIILVVAVTIFFSLKSKKEKNEAWQGEVIKKQDLSDEDGDNHVFRLVFKTLEGKKKKVRVGEDLYRQTNIGDKFEKISGDYVPKRLA